MGFDDIYKILFPENPKQKFVGSSLLLLFVNGIIFLILQEVALAYLLQYYISISIIAIFTLITWYLVYDFGLHALRLWYFWPFPVMPFIIGVFAFMAITTTIPTEMPPSTVSEEEGAETYHTRGLKYYNNGQYDQAISDFNKALKINLMLAEEINPMLAEEINPMLADAYYKRGIAYADKGAYDPAISDYHRVIRISPRYAEAYMNRGIAYMTQDKYHLAIFDFNKALEINPILAEEINPMLADAYYKEGIGHANEGAYYTAIHKYHKVIKISPRYAEAYMNRGIAYMNYMTINRYDLAISDFNKALEINQMLAKEINPWLADAYYKRGIDYANKGKYALAISDYNRALEINPRFALAYHNRAVAYYAKREYGKAWEDVHKAQGLGYQVDPELIRLLREASGRQR